ncbi:MAG: hypothetical protein RR325_05810, partial [Bacilli bacterium]
MTKNKNDPLGPLNKLIDDTKVKIEKLESRIDNLYYDKENGIINLERYKRMSEMTEKEIKDLKKSLDGYELERMTTLDTVNKVVSYKKIVNSFLKMESPTKEMMNKIINRIDITKDKKIKIHYAIRELDNFLT